MIQKMIQKMAFIVASNTRKIFLVILIGGALVLVAVQLVMMGNAVDSGLGFLGSVENMMNGMTSNFDIYKGIEGIGTGKTEGIGNQDSVDMMNMTFAKGYDMFNATMNNTVFMFDGLVDKD